MYQHYQHTPLNTWSQYYYIQSMVRCTNDAAAKISQWSHGDRKQGTYDNLQKNLTVS